MLVLRFRLGCPPFYGLVLGELAYSPPDDPSTLRFSRTRVGARARIDLSGEGCWKSTCVRGLPRGDFGSWVGSFRVGSCRVDLTGPPIKRRKQNKAGDPP